MVESVKPERNTSHSPIFQTMFTLQNTKQEFLQLSERQMELMESHASVAKFDLSLFASETEEGLSLTLNIILICLMIQPLNVWQVILNIG